MSHVVLHVAGLTFGYPERSVFLDWSGEIRAGLTVIVGGDGAGKTTLLEILAGERDARGALTLQGVRQDREPDAYRRQVAWRDPRTDRFDQNSVTDYFDAMRGAFQAFDSAALERHIGGFGLMLHLAKPIHQLSTGSRRKVWMSASLASGAALTLLDEPKAALDGPSAAYLLAMLNSTAGSTSRACVVTDYAVPEGLAPDAVIELPE